MPRSGGEGEQAVTANGHRVSFWGDKDILKLDSGDTCITLQHILETTDLPTLSGWILRYVNYMSILKWKNNSKEKLEMHHNKQVGLSHKCKDCSTSDTL